MARGDRGGSSSRGNPVLGSQSNRSARSGLVLPPISNANATNLQSRDICSLCSALVGNDAVGCDRCDRWYHPSVMCMGMPETVIGNIKQYGGEGISYICTVCRSGNSRGGDLGTQSSALGQLLQTVAKLCETVQKLSDKVDGLVSGSVGGAVQMDLNSDQISALVSQECHEIEERKKRLTSIIIRGVNARTPASLSPIFEALTSELVGSPVQLSEIVCINAEKGMFRGKVVDFEARRKLLDSAKYLKNSLQFSSVYISRDLTYKQRQSMIARRARTRDENQNHVPPEVAAAAPSTVQGLSGGAVQRSRGAARPSNPLN